jgi:hypothetical protein
MALPNEDPNKAAAKSPIIVDLGKKRRKAVKKLRRGTGKLMDEVNVTLQELKNAGTISASSQPVIVVVRERQRSARNIFPFPGI